jgi:transposase
VRARGLIMLDNASYNHADPVTRATAELRIQLLYLPTYSPNLNLIERFWRFLKRKIARNRYYTTFAEFRIAVQNVLNNFVAYRDDLTALMTEHFQLFTTP